MKKIILILIICLTTTSFSQVGMTGGKGLLRVYEANPVYPGLLYVNPFYSTYFHIKEDNVDEDHSFNLGLTLGLNESFEVFSHIVPYQDDQKNIWGPFGDTKLGIKYSIPTRSKVTSFGFLSYISMPTGMNHNVPYEGFSTDAFGWALMGLVTVDLRDISTSFPAKFSFNLGYRDHDWSDRYFSAPIDQLLVRMGMKYPLLTSLLYSEITGEIFMNNTENVTPSQNFVRFTQGYRFIGPWDLVIDLAADIELGRFEPADENLKVNPYIKDYANWKFVVGVTYRTPLFKGKTKQEKVQTKEQSKESQKLDRIRKKRENVTDELERLRKKLNKENRPDSE